MRWPWIFALLVLARCAPKTQLGAGLVFFNARVMTRDPERPEVTAIAIQGDRIVAVGDDEDILALASDGAQRVDLGGGFVLPV